MSRTPSVGALYHSAITGIVIRVTNVYDDPAISETVYVGIEPVAPKPGWRLAPVLSLQQLNEWFVAVPVSEEKAALTFRQRLIGLLENHGLYGSDLDAVMQQVVADNPDMDRWDDCVEGYPTNLIASLWISAKRIAIEHLEQTRPQHFALMMLRDEVPA